MCRYGIRNLIGFITNLFNSWLFSVLRYICWKKQCSCLCSVFAIDRSCLSLAVPSNAASI